MALNAVFSEFWINTFNFRSILIPRAAFVLPYRSELLYGHGRERELESSIRLAGAGCSDGGSELVWAARDIYILKR